MTNGNEQAFSKAAFYHPDGGFDSPQEGLTKREYFAAMALQGFMANPVHSQKWSFIFIERLKDMFGFKANVRVSYASYLSKLAVKEADALINALNETK